MLTRLNRSLAGLAVSASLFGCAHHDAPTVSAKAAESARAVGVNLAAQDRENRARHRAQIAALARVGPVRVVEGDRIVRIAFTVHNLTSKRVKTLEFAFEADGTGGKRIGSAELRSAQTIESKATRSFVLQVPYTQFGDETAAMREALGQPQQFALDITEIKYGDGSDAGYDD